MAEQQTKQQTVQLADIWCMPAVGTNAADYPTHYQAVPHGTAPDDAAIHSGSADGQTWELREIVTVVLPETWRWLDGDLVAEVPTPWSMTSDSETCMVTVGIDRKGKAYGIIGDPREASPSDGSRWRYLKIVRRMDYA